MKRRMYLAVTCTAFTAGVAGCLGEMSSSNSGDANGGTEPENGDSPNAGNETGTITETSGVSDQEEDIMVDIRNLTPKEVPVRLTISTDEHMIVDEELDMGPEGKRLMATGINETGQYELTIVIEGGPEDSYPFTVGDYDLRAGSNVIVQLHEEDISFMMEE